MDTVLWKSRKIQKVFDSFRNPKRPQVALKCIWIFLKGSKKFSNYDGLTLSNPVSVEFAFKLKAKYLLA